jgi:hypothetical protein
MKIQSTKRNDDNLWSSNFVFIISCESCALFKGFVPFTHMDTNYDSMLNIFSWLFMLQQLAILQFRSLSHVLNWVVSRQLVCEYTKYYTDFVCFRNVWAVRWGPPKQINLISFYLFLLFHLTAVFLRKKKEGKCTYGRETG